MRSAQESKRSVEQTPNNSSTDVDSDLGTNEASEHVPEPTGDAELGRDGSIHCRWFAGADLDLVTWRLHQWTMEMGPELEICGLSHTAGPDGCTALVLWRLKPSSSSKRPATRRRSTKKT
jgi:hypothetical protein